MNTTSCTQVTGCVNDHHHDEDDYHQLPITTVAGRGRLRSDLVIDGDDSHLSIVEMLDWQIPLAEVPDFLARMRVELARIEQAHAEYVAQHRPIHRSTEPGEPEFAGVGGGL